MAKKEKIIPLKADYVPKDTDDPIVKQAYEMKQQDLKKQLNEVQTHSVLKGFTQADIQDVVDKQKNR